MHSQKKTLIVLILLVLSLSAVSQNMGTNSFSQLDIPYNARFAGIGGIGAAIRDKDPSLAFVNPSLLDTIHNNKAVLGYNNYLADMNYGFAGFCKSYNKIGNFSAALKYFNYGKFKETDYIGNVIGSFSAADYILAIGYSHMLDTSVYFGATLNTLYSAMGQYNSFGISTDLAVTYNKEGTNFVGSAMLKNLGYQLKPYLAGTRAKLPLDLVLAFSYKLKHAPFRFHFSFDKLTKWDITYLDPTLKPEIDPTTGKEIPIKQPGGFNKAMRHITPGAEIVIGKGFYLDLSFNFRKREELKYSAKPGMAGFNFGTGIFLKKMSIAVAFSKYALAGNSFQTTFSYAF